MNKQLNIALFSPNKDPFSETFIQAHKKYLKGNILYYYGKGEYIQLENQPPLSSSWRMLWLKVMKVVLKKDTSFVLERLLSRSFRNNNVNAVLVEYGIHAHHILPAVKRAKIPMVVHFHGYDAHVTENYRKRQNYREVFEYATYVIAVSRTMEDHLLQLGCPKEKLVYNANAAQSDFLEIVPDFTSEQFVSVGRFVNKKAPFYVILSFKEALKKYPNAKLIMCGDGLLLEACKNLVRYYRIENNIKFMGVTAPDQIKALYKESIGLIQHSVTAENGDMEGMPISVLEASAAGLPVISTFHAGISEVIENGVTGLLCNEHDVKNMGLNIIKILEDINYAKKLGNAGKERIKSNFNFEKHINGIQKLVEDSVKVQNNN